MMARSVGSPPSAGWRNPGMGPSCRAEELVAVFDVYIDDGGSPDVKLLCLSAYVARAKRWEAFTEAWGRILSDYTVEYIHLKDVLNQRSRQYRHLNRSQRTEMLDRAADVIGTFAEAGIITAISTAEYDLVTDQLYRSQHGSAFVFALGNTVLEIVRLLAAKPKGKRQKPHVLNIFFEDGHKNAKEAVIALSDTRERLNPKAAEDIPDDALVVKDPTAPTLPVIIGSIGTGTKKGSAARPPLQAADILVYSFVRRMQPLRDDDLADRTLARIEKRITHRVGFLTGDLLLKMVELTKTQAMREANYRHQNHQTARIMKRLGCDVEFIPDQIRIGIPEDWKLPDPDS